MKRASASALQRFCGQNRFLISLRILEREIALFVQRDLFVTDQRDGGVGGSGTGSSRRRVFNALRMHAGDTEHPNQPDEE
jgi:hypothetical protein